MKKLILFFAFILAANFSHAQVGKGMPPYRILTTDSNWATPNNLKKDRRTVLIYFSPDCPHCQHLTMDMKSKMKQFGDAQIVMITWSDKYDIRAIKNFVRDFDLKKYPNIIVGTEGYTYDVQKYFKIATTPFIAIYNNSGKQVKTFDKDPDISKVIEAVKQADEKKPGI
jgi:thioredoxin-related protein